MPIRPDLRHHYGREWRALSRHIRQVRAQGGCEFPGCVARHGELHPVTGSVVVLSVAHLDHDPANNRPSNLMAACQRCHLYHDRHQHRRSAAATRRARLRTLDLIDDRLVYTPPLLCLMAPVTSSRRSLPFVLPSSPSGPLSSRFAPPQEPFLLRLGPSPAPD